MINKFEITKNNERIVLSNDLIKLTIKLSNKKEIHAIKELLANVHPGDLADLLTFLNSEQRTFLLENLDENVYTSVLAEIDDSILDETIKSLDKKEVAKAISDMETNDAVSLIESLEPVDQQKILNEVSDEDREIFQESLNYPEDSAGRRMQKEYVALPSFWTVGQTIDYLREEINLPNDFLEIFVVDPMNKPLGNIPVSRVLRSSKNKFLSKIMQDNPILIPAIMDQEEVAYEFEKYSLVSAGVIDELGKLIGRITADDVVWVLQEEAEEDILLLGGVSETEANQNILQSVRKRFIWLFLNLLTAILASIVISLFDASIEKMVALAVLMPIIASMGGNAGTQTLTLTIRSLATRELIDSNRSKILNKEIGISFLNGIIFSIITGLLSYIWFRDLNLSLIVGTAIIVNIFSAGIFGFIIPYALNSMKIDPAIASSVFVTTVTDVVGFFCFLGLASIFLN
jgi:magnesium transporter